MPRPKRLLVDGHAYHVLNRGNDRRVIFKKTEDYEAFFAILREAQQRLAVPTIGVCLMPNHWHLVLWPTPAASLSAYMHWVMNAHVHRYHQHYHLRGLGHLYQDRYKSFPIQDDHHMYTVLRYVEANPLRAGLVTEAQAWQWSSLSLRARGVEDGILTNSLVPLPENWTSLVNEAIPESLLGRIQGSARRQTPFGEDEWVKRLEDAA
jgi:putative transposase